MSQPLEQQHLLRRTGQSIVLFGLYLLLSPCITAALTDSMHIDCGSIIVIGLGLGVSRGLASAVK